MSLKMSNFCIMLDLRLMAALHGSCDVIKMIFLSAKEFF